MAREKKEVFSPDLMAFDNRVQAYHEGDANLADYVEALAPAKSQGNAGLLAQAFEMEKNLDFNRVEADRKEIIEVLVKTLSQDQINHLIQESTAYRLGEIRYGDFYVYLKNICRGAKIDLARFPHMDAYIRYVLLSDQIDAEKLLTELAALEKARYGILAKTSEEKTLVNRSRALGLAGRLLTFELTPEDWAEYGVLNAGTALGLDMSSFEAFYREAHARDESLSANLLKAMEDRHSKTAVLVTGGYHTNGVSERLVKSGVTVVTFTPRIEKIDSENGSAYLSVFTQEKTPLEKLFGGEKLFLGGDAFSKATQNSAAIVAAGAAATNRPAEIAKRTFEKLGGKAVRFSATVKRSVVTVQVWASNLRESVRVIVERTPEGTLSVQQTVVVAFSIATIAAAMAPILSFGLGSISTFFVSLGTSVPGVSFFTTCLSAQVAVITGQEGHFVSAFSGWILDGVSVAAVSQLITVATMLTFMAAMMTRSHPKFTRLLPVLNINAIGQSIGSISLGSEIVEPKLDQWPINNYRDIFLNTIKVSPEGKVCFLFPDSISPDDVNKMITDLSKTTNREIVSNPVGIVGGAIDGEKAPSQNLLGLKENSASVILGGIIDVNVNAPTRDLAVAIHNSLDANGSFHGIIRLVKLDDEKKCWLEAESGEKKKFTTQLKSDLESIGQKGDPSNGFEGIDIREDGKFVEIKAFVRTKYYWSSINSLMAGIPEALNKAPDGPVALLLPDDHKMAEAIITAVKRASPGRQIDIIENPHSKIVYGRGEEAELLGHLGQENYAAIIGFWRVERGASMESFASKTSSRLVPNGQLLFLFHLFEKVQFRYFGPKYSFITSGFIPGSNSDQTYTQKHVGPWTNDFNASKIELSVEDHNPSALIVAGNKVNGDEPVSPEKEIPSMYFNTTRKVSMGEEGLVSAKLGWSNSSPENIKGFFAVHPKINTNPISPGAWAGLLRLIGIKSISNQSARWVFPAFAVVEGFVSATIGYLAEDPFIAFLTWLALNVLKHMLGVFKWNMETDKWDVLSKFGVGKENWDQKNFFNAMSNAGSSIPGMLLASVGFPLSGLIISIGLHLATAVLTSEKPNIVEEQTQQAKSGNRWKKLAALVSLLVVSLPAWAGEVALASSMPFVSLGTIVPGVSDLSTLLSAVVAVVTGQGGHFVAGLFEWNLAGFSVAAVSQLITVATMLTFTTAMLIRNRSEISRLVPAVDATNEARTRDSISLMVAPGDPQRATDRRGGDPVFEEDSRGAPPEEVNSPQMSAGDKIRAASAQRAIENKEERERLSQRQMEALTAADEMIGVWLLFLEPFGDLTIDLSLDFIHLSWELDNLKEDIVYNRIRSRDLIGLQDKLIYQVKLTQKILASVPQENFPGMNLSPIFQSTLSEGFSYPDSADLLFFLENAFRVLTDTYEDLNSPYSAGQEKESGIPFDQ
ncbi:MAG: hypothetical protein IPN19_00740 [Elusimicrobia bacterium]|nr:hypothetical protein [Elusimicrobiota bacterium]